MVLWDKPCPAFNGSICLIYNVRPYPCRQFLCGKHNKDDNRPFVSDTKFNMEYFDKQLEEFPEFAEVKEKIENEAAEWGNKHGWKLERIK